MDKTFTISNDGTDTGNGIEGTTLELNPLNSNKKKSSTESCCPNHIFFILSCIFTTIILVGFGYIFGPLILQNKHQLYKFNNSHVNIQHYRLRLEPDLKSDKLYGRASLIVNISNNINELHLIMQDLTIDHVNITKRHSIDITPANNEILGINYHILDVSKIYIKSIQTVNKLNDFNYTSNTNNDTDVNCNLLNSSEVLITLEKPIDKGEYLIDIHYSSTLSDSGLEKIEYLDEEDNNIKRNKTFIILKDPSRVFPYFDNNQLIHFEISVSRTTDVTCFSNVLLKETETIPNKNGYVWDHFRITPAILPSSLSLVITKDYKILNVPTDHNRKSSVFLKILSRKSYLPSLTYTSEILPAIFEYFQKFFTMKYSLSKLDLITVEDEIIESKLGLIVIDSRRLILNKKINDNIENRREIFTIIAEAIAKQWLYQLNYDNTSIINGFAKFLAFSANKALNTDENSNNNEENFAYEVLGKSLELDLRDEKFKFASVLRMINNSLTEKVFQSILNKYIISSSNHELFGYSEFIRLSGNITLKELIASWMDNDDYPIMTVTRTTGWNVLIEQESMKHAQLENTFIIPLNYISQNNNQIQWFYLKSKQVERNLMVPKDDWILFNYNRIGLYRVNYQLENWLKLIQQLELQHSTIPPINRAQIISDAFALADNNLLQYHIPFSLIKYLQSGNETNYLVWKTTLDALNQHESVFLDSSKYGLFRKFKKDLLSNLWNIRTTLDINLSHLIENELCKLKYKPCIAEALELYEQLKHRKDAFIPKWIYCIALAHMEDQYEYLFGKLQQSTNSKEIHELLQSLICTKEDWELNQFLEYSVSNKKYAKTIWQAMSTTSMGHVMGLTFIEAKWSKWMSLLVENNSYQSRKLLEFLIIIIEDYLSTFSRPMDLIRIHKLYVNSPNTLEESFDRAMTDIGRRVKWVNKNFDTFVLNLSSR